MSAFQNALSVAQGQKNAISFVPGILLKLIQYRVLIILLIQDSKRFLKPAQRFKMESKRVFRILNHFRPTLPHIKCPGKSIFVLNWNKNLERIVMFLETERCESGLISTLGKRV